jgi:23S rRNA (cytosine1962-C5)-methyltransferase
MNTSREKHIFVAKPEKDYELLDSGNGEKLERFGNVVLARPDPQALWKKRLSEKEWEKADGIFVKSAAGGAWKFRPNAPKQWEIELAGLRFVIKPSTFKHVGVFPEQISNWQWMQEKIREAKAKNPEKSISVLNLFGYTGGATLACAEAGAEVCHVDGSRVAIKWAGDNARASKLENKPIRWIPDDAREFVARENRRGNKYDAIILDPPTFGRGPKGEVWKIENELLPLIESCRTLLSEHPLFILINGYAAGYSAIAYGNILFDITQKLPGSVECGELTLAQTSDMDTAERRLLPAGIMARWTSAE